MPGRFRMPLDGSMQQGLAGGTVLVSGRATAAELEVAMGGEEASRAPC